MKKIIHFIVILFSLNMSSQENNDIKLTLELDTRFGETITILAKNNNDSKIELFSTIDGSFWCLTKPCVKFKIEEHVNGTWKSMDYKITQMRCGNYDDWKKITKSISIEKGETKSIGSFRFPKNISGWFNFYGDKKIRLTATYTISGNKNELSKFGLKPIKIVSEPLEIDYKNKLHPVDYFQFFEDLRTQNKLTKKNFRQGAKTIKYPGSDKKKLELAFKEYGIRVSNLHNKIIQVNLNDKTTDEINPAIISSKIINDDGIFYLVLFIRHTSYDLEKDYTKDFCKIYKIN